MVATAGLGDVALGGFLITEEVGGLGLVSIELPVVEAGLEFRMAAGGLEAATFTVGTMATEHLITAQKDFDNPVAQAYWRQGAYTFNQYAKAATLSFAAGAGTVAAVSGVARFFQGIRGLLRNSRVPRTAANRAAGELGRAGADRTDRRRGGSLRASSPPSFPM